MLINPANLINYFPDACLDDLELKSTQAQSIIESYLVANRSLEIQKYTELKTVKDSGTVLLLYLPILNDSENYPIKVEVRNKGQQWLELNPDRYVIDFDLGELQIIQASNEYWSSSHNAPRSGLYGSRSRLTRGTSYQAKITYYSGFDLENSELIDNLSETFKNNLINLIKFQSSESNAGLKKFILTEHYEVEYQSASDKVSATDSSGAGNPLNDLLAYFKKFKARTFNH
jgi:hypothetical protein